VRERKKRENEKEMVRKEREKGCISVKIPLVLSHTLWQMAKHVSTTASTFLR